MRLSELEPEFLKDSGEGHSRMGVSKAEADGIMFLCPVCFAKNNGPVGTHSIICWQPHVDPNRDPKPGRWAFQGTGIGDLTLVAASSSIYLNGGGGCQAHFFIRNGNIE